MTGLDFYLRLFDRLSDHSAEGGTYRMALEEVLGVPTDGAIFSTSEHIAPFNSATTVSFLLPALTIQAKRLRRASAIVILGCAMIPLDNADYPRGFVLPSSFTMSSRINLVSNRDRKTCPALRSPAHMPDGPVAATFVRRYPWLLDPFECPDQFRTYAQQMSRCMELIASHWLPTNESVPLCIRPLEEVAGQVLARLLEGNDPWLNKLLFEKECRTNIARRLHGVFCAWGDRQGSFLFWGASNGRALRLWEDGEALVCDGFHLPLNRESVYRALLDGIIWPGVFLALLAVSYLPNIPVAGGPKQLHYFEDMVDAANQVGGLYRNRALSQFGYNCVSFEQLAVPAVGTGLALADELLSPDMMVRDLSRSALLPSVRAVYA